MSLIKNQKNIKIFIENNVNLLKIWKVGIFMNREEIGMFIATLRKEKKLTQEELAERLGVTNKTISRWETGKYMPDLSLLSELSKELGVTINDLLNGERIDKDELEEKTEENIVETINYAQIIIKKSNRKLLIVISSCILFAIGLFGIFDYIYFSPGIYYEGDVSKWEDSFPNHSAYELGLNSGEMPVFKDPNKALKQAKVDYSDAIKEISKKFKLLPLTKYTYKQYGMYGWQVASDNEMINEQGRKLSQFLDIYENSF